MQEADSIFSSFLAALLATPPLRFSLFTLMDVHALICSIRGNKAVHEIELGIFAFELFERSEISVSIRSGLVIQCALSIPPPPIWNAIILFDIEFWYRRCRRLRRGVSFERGIGIFSKRFRSTIPFFHVFFSVFFYINARKEWFC